MDSVAPDDELAIWTAWQARRQASAAADAQALARGEKTREQLVVENGAVPEHIAKAALAWDDLLW